MFLRTNVCPATRFPGARGFRYRAAASRAHAPRFSRGDCAAGARVTAGRHCGLDLLRQSVRICYRNAPMRVVGAFCPAGMTPERVDHKLFIKRLWRGVLQMLMRKSHVYLTGVCLHPERVGEAALTVVAYFRIGTVPIFAVPVLHDRVHGLAAPGQLWAFTLSACTWRRTRTGCQMPPIPRAAWTRTASRLSPSRFR